MSLVPDYEDSSNSDELSSDSDEEINTGNTDQDVITKPKLPTPSFLLNDNKNNAQTSSVFKNPYVEAENAKEAILQKHVKMVQNKDNIKAINGKHICWNYRKGKCRFGHNCKFAHDSDVQIIDDRVVVEENFQSQKEESSKTTIKLVRNNKEKRKRPGLSNTLIPNKKVIKDYYKQKLN